MMTEPDLTSSLLTSAKTRPDPIGRLTAFVLRHRRWVAGFWLVMLVAGGIGAGRVSSRLSYDFSLPGQPGYQAAQRIIATYGNGADTPPTIVVVDGPAGRAGTRVATVAAGAFGRLRQAEPAVIRDGAQRELEDAGRR